MELNRTIYAHVILRSAGGKAFSETSIITAATVDKYKPSKQDVRLVQAHFERAGFQISELVGISFDISGLASLFETFFKVSLIEDDTGAVCVEVANKTPSHEIPLDSLNDKIAILISNIALPTPPDFGPEGSFL